MKTFAFEITQTVMVQIDEQRFGQEQMAEFNKVITDFGLDEDAYEHHAKHLAELAARGIDLWEFCFIEGYGQLKQVGIRVAIDEHMIQTDCIERGAS